EDLFWRWVGLRGHSAQELDELKEDRLLHRILDQRDLRIRFAHLVSKRKLYSEMEGLKRRAQSGARNERGYGFHASATVPRPSAKKPRITYEVVAASDPRSRQPSGSQPGAARSAPMSSVTRDTLATSPRAGASFGGAAHGARAPRGSGFPHYGRGGPAEALLDYAYEAPPQREAPRSSARSPDQSVLLQQQEIHDLRDRVYTLEIALGLGPGGQAAAQSGKPGSLSLLRGDVDRLSQECGDLHSRVDRRASSYDVDCLRDEVAHLRSEIQNRPSYPGNREPQSYAYSQPYYGSYPYGGASSRSQAYAYDQSPAPASAWRSPQREAGARFEVVNSPPQNPLSLPAGDQKPEGRGSASDEPHKTSGGSSST
uniref:Uncharacterized protein n=1 Tax=Phytophthora ramorum TaxID=164328 RepID=H3H6U4_PHYRM